MIIWNPQEFYPGYKAPLPESVPDELKGYTQWIVWRLEKLPSDKKPKKVPYSPLRHQRSGSNEKYRATWGTFDQACQTYSAGIYAGISLAITENDPFVVIDFDHCVSSDGQIDDWVRKWIDALDSYTEFSPSGTGIHIIVRGKKPGERCKKVGLDYEIEMYEKLRFITITGHVVDEKHFLSQNQEALKELYNERLDVGLKPVQAAPEKPVAPLEMDDCSLIETIRKSKQGSKFDRLMAGDCLSYANKDNDGRSEADMALCGILAWWSQKDPERIDRIFRTSQLLRPKWDEMHGAQTYGQLTIDNAIKNTSGQYDPEAQKRKRKSNVVSIRKNDRRVITTDTGFENHESQKVLFTEPYPWPKTGTHHYIDTRTGALYRGQPYSDTRDLIALRPVWVHSLGRDEFGEKYRVIKFFDEDFIPQVACFPSQWFTKLKDANVWTNLVARGMVIMSGKEKYVSRFLDLLHSVCDKRSWAPSKLGWFEALDEHGNQTRPVFVLPEKILGETGDGKEVFFQSTDEVSSKSITNSGSLKEWKTHVADKAFGNYLPMFCIMCGLAGGLSKIANTASGGFHFWGLTSFGKTALLQCAASVWGDASDPQTNSQKTSIRKWNATASGLEATAQLHNDIVLCLDEIDELEPGELSKLIYTLTGGTPKSRMQETGGLRKQSYWHIMLLSSGETSTENILKNTGHNKRGGQLHRLPDIRVDVLENGIVQTETENAAQFVEDLKLSCSQYYGVAGPVFITWLLNEMEKKGRDKFCREMKKAIESVQKMLQSGIDPLPNEIRRVLKRMATVAVAGAYASEAGILNWLPHHIQSTILFVRDLWLADMDGQFSEIEKALDSLRGSLLSNQANFEHLYRDNPKTPFKMMGYRDDFHIMIYPNVFDEFCKSYSKRQLLEALQKRDYLSLGEFNKENNKHRIAKKIPPTDGRSRPRCYWIDVKFLEE